MLVKVSSFWSIVLSAVSPENNICADLYPPICPAKGDNPVFGDEPVQIPGINFFNNIIVTDYLNFHGYLQGQPAQYCNPHLIIP